MAVETVGPGWTASEWGVYFTEAEARTEYAIDLAMEKQLEILREELRIRDQYIDELKAMVESLNNEVRDLLKENRKLRERKWGIGVFVGVTAPDGEFRIGIGITYNFTQF